MSIPASLGEERHRRAGALLAAAGLRGPFRLTALAGGANNQVFRVDLPGQTVLLKAYFVHPDDPRDRLRADYGFSRFAWDRGVRALARPLAADASAHLALFDFLPGAKLKPEDVTRPPVREALDFFLAVNAHRGAAEARDLPTGSEACFTLQDHLHCVRRRVSRLQTMEAVSPVDRDALALVRGELTFLSDLALNHAEGRAAALGLALDQPVNPADRCLSPSDFGFHNALRGDDSRMKFIDFEYAGWDDPAKTVADFFCQPECPVPAEFFEEFAGAVAGQTSDPELHLHRFRLLLPVYRLKWCCIMLNDFLAAGGSRRRFARGGDENERKARQLRKARAALRNVFPQGGWPRAM